MGLCHPRGWTLHMSFLNVMFLSVHFSSLPGSLWTAALHSSSLNAPPLWNCVQTCRWISITSSWLLMKILNCTSLGQYHHKLLGANWPSDLFLNSYFHLQSLWCKFHSSHTIIETNVTVPYLHTHLHVASGSPHPQGYKLQEALWLGSSKIQNFMDEIGYPSSLFPLFLPWTN